MGAVGRNAAAKQATDPTERIAVANAGRARWTPVNALGIGAYAVSGAIIMQGNKSRLASQQHGDMAPAATHGHADGIELSQPTSQGR